MILTSTKSTTQGLVSNVTLGKDVLSGWTMYSLNIDEAVSQGLIQESQTQAPDSSQPASLSLPTFYRGSFRIPAGIPDLPQDTFVQFPGWRKACGDDLLI